MGKVWVVFVILLLAMPAFGQVVDPWNAAFELDPADTDLISAGDDEIRRLKTAISERLEVQHEWAAGAGESYMGFHLEGSAWILSSNNCNGEGIDADQEEGQLCRQTTDNSIWQASAGGVGTWTQLTPSRSNVSGVLGATFDGYVPTNAIILWDAVGGDGDEDCNGGTTAGECPCGYTKAGEYDGLTIRGADEAAGDVNIPDAEGENCVGDGSGNDPPCVTQAGRYADIITEVQMPAHTHDIDIEVDDDAKVGISTGIYPGPGPTVTNSTGDDDPHYHPFRTVLFCRKN